MKTRLCKVASFVQDEKQRIEDLGGCVTFIGCWRVNGTYAVSRAIGKSTLTKNKNRQNVLCDLSVFIVSFNVLQQH